MEDLGPQSAYGQPESDADFRIHGASNSLKKSNLRDDMPLVPVVLHHVLSPWLLRRVVPVALDLEGATRAAELVAHFLEQALEGNLLDAH